jgi:hypothetical protein
MLRHAFKEWAVICEALAQGKQAIILRKGGIFRPEHRRFWLYPTFVHQQREGIKPQLLPLLEECEERTQPVGSLMLTHFAEISGVYHVMQLASACLLDALHGWSMETVIKRFEYRTPGLFVLPVRIYKAKTEAILPELPVYAGCKTWVELERELPTKDAMPVLDDASFAAIEDQLERILKPTMLA